MPGNDARQRCLDQITEHGPATMAELRDAWGVTREFGVLLCEYSDSIGVTTRDRDFRSAGDEAKSEF
jgi:hypothetical protein